MRIILGFSSETKYTKRKKKEDQDSLKQHNKARLTRFDTILRFMLCMVEGRRK